MWFYRAYGSLAVRQFRWLVIAHFTSLVGTVAQQCAVEWWMKEQTSGSEMFANLRILALMGILLGGLVVMWLGDKIAHWKILCSLQVVGLVQALAFLIAYHQGLLSPWLAVWLNAVNWVIAGVDFSIRNPFNTQVAGDKFIASARTVNVQATQFGIILGMPLAGILIAATESHGIGSYGISICFAANAISYVLPMIVITLVGKRQQERRQQERLRAGIVELIRRIWRELPVRKVVLRAMVLSSFSLYHPTFLPVFAKDILEGDARTLGYLWAAWAAGKLIAATVSGTIAQSNWSKWAERTLVAQAFALAAFAMAPNLPWALVTLAIASVFNHIHISLNVHEIQAAVESEVRGRMMSLYMWGFTVPEIFAIWGAGQMADTFGLPYTLIGYALTGMAVSLVLLGWLRRREKARKLCSAPVI